eukprot:COSAG04_NODE_670_length_11367_cov_62.932109_4_plen_221_part_00
MPRRPPHVPVSHPSPGSALRISTISPASKVRSPSAAPDAAFQGNSASASRPSFVAACSSLAGIRGARSRCGAALDQSASRSPPAQATQLPLGAGPPLEGRGDGSAGARPVGGGQLLVRELFVPARRRAAARRRLEARARLRRPHPACPNSLGAGPLAGRGDGAAVARPAGAGGGVGCGRLALAQPRVGAEYRGEARRVHDAQRGRISACGQVSYARSSIC